MFIKGVARTTAFVLIFFAITFVLHLWIPTLITAPTGYDYVPKGTNILPVYKEAIARLIPWFIFSPWTVVEALMHQSDCGLACVFVLPIVVIVTFVIYTAVVTGLLYLFRRNKKFGITGVVIAWLLFAGSGIALAEKYFIQPTKEFNSTLEILKSISHENPFPGGTTMGEWTNNPEWGSYKFWQKAAPPRAVISLRYKNPARTEEEYSIQMVIFKNSAVPDSINAYYANSPYGCRPIENTPKEIKEGIYECYNTYPGSLYAHRSYPVNGNELWTDREIYGFLDSANTVYATITITDDRRKQSDQKEFPQYLQRFGVLPSDITLPTFFKYYLGN